MTRVLKISIFGIFLLFNQSIYAGQLKYPGDCNSKKIIKAAKKGGCTIEYGAKHHKIKKDGSVITLLPNTVKPNYTCKSIIETINTQCSK